MISTVTATKPVRAVGGFYAMLLDTLLAIPRKPFAWRELIVQTWFVARVSFVPTLMLVVPFTVVTAFTINILLTEIGAADLSGNVMGVKSVAYLTSTRPVAGVITVIPLFCVAVISAVVGTRLSVTITYGQSTGVYDHYFRTFQNPLDLMWSALQALFMAILIMLIHTYYGFTASGGPSGWGRPWAGQRGPRKSWPVS